MSLLLISPRFGTPIPNYTLDLLNYTLSRSKFVGQIRISNCLKQRISTCSYSLYISGTRVTIQFVGQGQVTDNDQERGERTASKMAAFQMTNYTPWKEHKGGRAGRRTKL